MKQRGSTQVEESGLGVEIEPEVDERPQRPQRPRAPAADAFEEEEDPGDHEVLLATDVPKGEKIPIFRGVKVVYVGPEMHHAPTLKGRVDGQNVGGARTQRHEDDGRVIVEIVGGTLVKKASAGNFTNYDFRARDLAGVESTKRMPQNHRIAEVRGRPYQDVEHAEHIYHFARRPQDYHIVVGPESRFALREYIAARERSRKIRQQFIDKTTAA